MRKTPIMRKHTYIYIRLETNKNGNDVVRNEFPGHIYRYILYILSFSTI